MDKTEVLKKIVKVRDGGLCNMIDKECVERILRENGDEVFSVYVSNLSLQEYVQLIVYGLGDYVQLTN